MTPAQMWTLDAYIAHNEALRDMHGRLEQERDRRYSEVKAAEEKALRVKDIADRDALSLAREIQAYKDEKANELREQIYHIQATLATKVELEAAIHTFDVRHQPVLDFIAKHDGRGVGLEKGWILLLSGATFLVALIAIGTFIFTELVNPKSAVAPPSITLPVTPR